MALLNRHRADTVSKAGGVERETKSAINGACERGSRRFSVPACQAPTHPELAAPYWTFLLAQGLNRYPHRDGPSDLPDAADIAMPQENRCMTGAPSFTASHGHTCAQRTGQTVAVFGPIGNSCSWSVFYGYDQTICKQP
jgi:hypothetical protein